MPEYRTFRDRTTRLPTAAEVRQERALAESGVADVFIPLDQAQQSFWEAIFQAITGVVIAAKNLASPTGRDWWDELRWQQGWPEHQVKDLPAVFDRLIRQGRTSFSTGDVEPYVRLSAIEHVLDVVDDDDGTRQFESLANEAAERFRVGIRLEGTRFVEVTSQLVHKEVVRPVLMLLTEPRLVAIDDLYRKAFDRLLSGDAAGAITAAASAVEEMLRVGGLGGSSLKTLALRAREAGWITPGVEQSIVKLDAFRGDSDAHRVGTDEKELARLVVHLVGALLLYLGRTMPNAS